jgi:hypothetical protein
MSEQTQNAIAGLLLLCCFVNCLMVYLEMPSRCDLSDETDVEE